MSPAEASRIPSPIQSRQEYELVIDICSSPDRHEFRCVARPRFSSSLWGATRAGGLARKLREALGQPPVAPSPYRIRKVGQFGTNIPTAKAVFVVGVVAIKEISAGQLQLGVEIRLQVSQPTCSIDV